MVPIVLSLSPLPADLVKAFILQTPGVPEFEMVAGHEMSDAELKTAVMSAVAILGDYTFKRGITAEIVAVAGGVKLIQQPSAGGC